jgi:hypothetical protein
MSITTDLSIPPQKYTLIFPSVNHSDHSAIQRRNTPYKGFKVLGFKVLKKVIYTKGIQKLDNSKKRHKNKYLKMHDI